MISSSRRSIARALALLALIGCQWPSRDNNLARNPIGDGASAATTTVGMWGNDDGWSLVEPLRLGVVDPRPPVPMGEGRCSRVEAVSRLHPLDPDVETVVGAVDAAGLRRG